MIAPRARAPRSCGGPGAEARRLEPAPHAEGADEARERPTFGRAGPRRAFRRQERAPLEPLVIVALILLNGLLAGAEIAVVSVRSGRLRELAASGRAAGRALQRLRAEPEEFLATVQIGITLIGAATGAFGGAAFAEDVEPVVRSVPLLAPYALEVAFALVVIGITYVSVVLGELVPKSLALRASERYALVAARPLLLLSRMARPVVWLLAGSSNLVLRLFGDRTSFLESRLSPDEIRQSVLEARTAGALDPEVGEITARALDLADLTAEDVLIHRRFVVALPASLPVAEARRRYLGTGHEQVPVVEDETQDVVGYVTCRLFADLPDDDAASTLHEIARKPLYVPEGMPAVDLLRELQRRRVPLAVVVDDYGGTIGIVTLRDLLEELVGEILGEHEHPAAQRIRPQPDGSALVDGIVPILIANRKLGLGLPDDDRASTVGGLCSLLSGGRIPKAGEIVRSPDGTVLVPVDVSPRRVRIVAVHPAPDGLGGNSSED